MKNIIKTCSLLCMLLLFGEVNSFAQSRPISIDSRIKTLVYSENEVFRIVVHYGWQTIIEFAEHEEIQTISVGNNYAWQVSPLDRRLFIKPLEENILTNMTVITNLRSYQFEIESKSASSSRDDELTFVVRFFYPDNSDDKILPQIETQQVDSAPVEKPFNYNYTMSKPNKLSPTEVFDDGIGTFFKFEQNAFTDMPKFQAKDKNGTSELIPQHRGLYIYVNKISKEFIISDKKKVVHIFNQEYSDTE